MAWTERYVSVAGGGTHDGTTGANAFTWAEMLATTENRQSKRYNIISGTYARTTSADVFTVTGGAPTAAAPMWLRGYGSAIGDLDANGRTGGTGALITTGFPAITYTTGNLTTPNYTIETCLSVSGQTAGSLGVLATGLYNLHRWLSILNTRNDIGGCLGLFAGLYGTAMDCDLGGGTFSAGLSCDRANVFNSRFTTGSIGFSANTFGGAFGCQFLDVPTGMKIDGLMAAANNNSFRNNATACISSNAQTTLIMNNAAWGPNSGTSKFYSGGSVLPVFYRNNAVGNMAAADANIGDYDVLGAIALTADPFTSATDLTPNSAAGGGALLKAAGFQSYIDIGAIQVQATGGGSVAQRTMAMSIGTY